MKTNLLGTNLNVIGYYFAYLSIEHNYTTFLLMWSLQTLTNVGYPHDHLVQ